MKNVITFLCLLTSFQLTAQLLPMPIEQVAGTWTCRDVAIDEKSEIAGGPVEGDVNEMVAMSKAMFVDSQFILGADGIFYWQPSKKKKNPALEDFSFMNGKIWTYNAQTGMVRVGTVKENLLMMYVHQRNGTVLFLMVDTPVVFTMVKAATK